MDSVSRILEILNHENQPPKELRDEILEISAPVAGTETHNTKLVLYGIPGKGYYGSVDIFYRRINLSDEITGDLSIRSETPLVAQDFLDQLSKYLTVDVTMADVEPFVVPDLQAGQSAPVEIVAVSDSYGWMGSATINYEYGRPYLNVMVKNVNLDIQFHPVPYTGYRSARMATWHLDFTSLRDAIKPDQFANYTSWETLQSALVAMGIPSWFPDKITDRPTSMVPEANQAFDRVVVQQNVSSAELEGTVYLHYNLFDEA